MRANELRIGNLLLFNNMITKEEIVKVNAWFLRQLVHDPYIENPQLTGYYQPIPLTEEWLIRFGFENDKDYPEWWTFKSFSMDNTEIGFSYDEDLQVKHVHQLQNLYFALTGEELTLKSKVTKPNQN